MGFQPESPEPPVVGRPEDFSQLVGFYQIRCEAQPTELSVEDPLTLTVRIQGEGPRLYQPVRKNLRVFPPRMSDDFYIEALPAKDRYLEADKTWEFVYRLRPKRLDVKHVPSLKLIYYSPTRQRFQSTYSTAIPLVVKPRKVAQAPSEAVAFVRPPQQFYDLATGSKVLRREDSLPWWIFIFLAFLPLGLCAVWYAQWRLHHPNARRNKVQRQSRAALQALNALDQKPNTDQIFEVVTLYLRNRFDFQGAEPTGLEVNRRLTGLGVAKKARHLLVEFFQACDAARFAPTIHQDQLESLEPSNSENLKTAAVHLIQTLEADPCFHRV